jgi:hypothetical protein
VGEAGGGVYEGDGRCNLIFRIFFLDFLSSNGIKQLYIDFKLKIWALAAVGTATTPVQTVPCSPGGQYRSRPRGPSNQHPWAVPT